MNDHPFALYGLPQCYIPEVLIIYKIPIKNCSKYVYMRPNFDNGYSYTPIFVLARKFANVWEHAKRILSFTNNICVTYSELLKILINDTKLMTGEVYKSFEEGITNPVKLPIISSMRDNTLYLSDGNTRTIYLLVNNAEIFPIMCPTGLVHEIKKLCYI